MMLEQQGRAEVARKPATAVEELRIGMRRASRSTPVRMKCALLFLPLLGLTPSCLIIDSTGRRPDQVRGLPAQVAFGSCGHQAKPQPILDTVVAQEPDLFIYLGDNIYGDTESMTLLASKYQQLGAKPGFQALRRTSAVVATWDDHDYGSNDAGKEYSKKEESKEIFLDFWAEHSLSERRRRPGIYTHYDFEEKGRRMQVILLDSRTFRTLSGPRPGIRVSRTTIDLIPILKRRCWARRNGPGWRSAFVSPLTCVSLHPVFSSVMNTTVGNPGPTSPRNSRR